MIMRVTRKKERFSTYSHIFGLILAVIGCIFLFVLNGNNIPYLVVIVIYSICICYMFSASILYHASKKTEKDQTFWRKFDHIAIFYMIAGSYTIISFIYIDGVFKWIIIALQWTFAILGTILKSLTLKIPIWLDVGIYLVMGWMIAIRFDYILVNVSLKIFLLILFGGLAYTIGAILHAINKPFPLPKRFEFHDIFHILIIVGAGLHYLAILFAFI